VKGPRERVRVSSTKIESEGASWSYSSEVATKDEGALLGSLDSSLKPLGTKLHKRLLAEKCVPYVKTIYIGYYLDGVMVAALYPHSDRVELALALPEDHPSDLLIDATHLTWRTLAVAAVVKSQADATETMELIDEACQRVKDGVHDVERPNDYFMKARRESAEDRFRRGK
jgi:hypothetical protein